jgi:hypothetical protein
MVAGAESSIRNYSYLKSYSTTGNTTYYQNDLALTGIVFDTAYFDHPSSLPAGIYRYNLVAHIEVQNMGMEEINSFNINLHYPFGGICGDNISFEVVDNIQLQPGQSLSVALDTIYEYGIPGGAGIPFTYTFCPWISCSDAKVDNDHSNDQLCDSISILRPTAIDELTALQQISIFPNPFESEIHIRNSYKGYQHINYILVDLVGNHVMHGEIFSEEFILNLKEQPAGIYFLQMENKGERLTKKLIKSDFVNE